MPETDGLQAAAYIREREKQLGMHIPIVAMTAHAMKGDRERCLEGGMEGYLSKLITPRISESNRRGAPGFGERPGSTRIWSKRRKNRRRVTGALWRDAELLKELAELFLQGCPKMLEDIRVVLQKRDAKAIENAEHSLKGSVGNFFSQGARDTAQPLELLGRSGDLTGAEELVRLLEEQVGEFNRVLARSIESVQQPH